jgi:hypothetical protein
MNASSFLYDTAMLRRAGKTIIALLFPFTVFQAATATTQFDQVLSDFLGVWILGEADNNQCKASDWKAQENDRLINVSSSSVEYWEDECKILSVKRSTPGQYDTTVNVELACGGEGLTWRSKEIWALQTIDHRKMFVATTVSTSNARDDLGRKTNEMQSGPSVSIYLQCR